jgi:hypothetical protein
LHHAVSTPNGRSKKKTLGAHVTSKQRVTELYRVARAWLA